MRLCSLPFSLHLASPRHQDKFPPQTERTYPYGGCWSRGRIPSLREFAATVSPAPNLRGQQLGNQLVRPRCYEKFNNTGERGAPRPCAKAAPLGKAKSGSSSPHIRRDQHGVCKVCSPCSERGSGDPERATLGKARGARCVPNVVPGDSSRWHPWGKYPWPLSRTPDVFVRPGQLESYHHHPGQEVRSSWKAGTYWNQIPWVEKSLTLRYLGLSLWEC